jgi:hypothetical protein
MGLVGWLAVAVVIAFVCLVLVRWLTGVEETKTCPTDGWYTMYNEPARKNGEIIKLQQKPRNNQMSIERGCKKDAYDSLRRDVDKLTLELSRLKLSVPLVTDSGAAVVEEYEDYEYPPGILGFGVRRVTRQRNKRVDVSFVDVIRLLESDLSLRIVATRRINLDGSVSDVLHHTIRVIDLLEDEKKKKKRAGQYCY